ncbi:hypothetical protein ACKWTF_010214 [Chironomus riparius]
MKKECESVDQFIWGIQTQADSCEFNQFKEEAIRNQIFFGLHNNNLREKLILSQEKSLHTLISKIKIYYYNQQQLAQKALDSINVNQLSAVDQRILSKLTSNKSEKAQVKSNSVENLKGKKRKEKVCAVEERENCKSNVIVNCDELKEHAESNVWCKKLLVHDKMINFKLDTGSQVNTISIDMFKRWRIRIVEFHLS